jgi:hypothetical protein
MSEIVTKILSMVTSEQVFFLTIIALQIYRDTCRDKELTQPIRALTDELRELMGRMDK